MVYPQLVAPGVGIRTTDLYGGYVDESGTSMAAPHVAGAVALLLSAFPGLSAERQQAALQNSAWDLGDPGPENTYGFGRLDTLAAYNWLLASPDFTISSSPTSATAPPGGTASYLMSVGSTGGFAGDISLTLSGLSASQASWSFSPTAIVGGSGSSQLSITTASNLAPGSYPLTITATSGSVSHAASATLIVPAPPDFTVSVSPTSRSVAAGTGTSATVTVGSLNGFASGVSFSVAGLPPAVGSYAFSPAVVNGFGNSQLTLTTSATAPPGTYPLTISGTSGSTSHSSTFTFIVTNAPDFALSATPASISVRRSQSASFAISVSSVGGLTGNVSLSVVGLPGRATASWSNNPMAAPGSSTLVVRTTSTTPRGTFTLRLSGRSGSLVHQATVTLTVT
jgi:hypothetical protein